MYCVLASQESHPITQIYSFSLAYIVKVLAQSYLAANQFMCQVVVLLLQTHVGLLQTTILPLDRAGESEMIE